MLPRHAMHTLMALAAGFPVIAITGPRQSGKTTLARQAFGHLPYVNLEDPDTRELALADPRRFFASLPEGAVLDEVQRAPELMSYLLGIADSAPTMGRWVLTGSQQFGLMDGIGQSLAYRAAGQPPGGAAAALPPQLWQTPGQDTQAVLSGYRPAVLSDAHQRPR